MASGKEDAVADIRFCWRAGFGSELLAYPMAPFARAVSDDYSKLGMALDLKWWHCAGPPGCSDSAERIPSERRRRFT